MSGDFLHHRIPGETDADFEATMEVVKAVHCAAAFSFKYSSRPGTPGADLPDHLPEKVKAERLERLQALLIEQQKAFNESCVGREVSLLLEKPGRYGGQLIGRSPWLQSVIVDAKDERIGVIIVVILLIVIMMIIIIVIVVISSVVIVSIIIVIVISSIQIS